MIGISSTGAILGVLCAGLLLGIDKMDGTLPEAAFTGSNLIDMYGTRLLHITWESFISLANYRSIFFVSDILVQTEKAKVIDISRGIVLTFVGLVIFLLGVNGGFMAWYTSGYTVGCNGI